MTETRLRNVPHGALFTLAGAKWRRSSEVEINGCDGYYWCHLQDTSGYGHVLFGSQTVEYEPPFRPKAGDVYEVKGLAGTEFWFAYYCEDFTNRFVSAMGVSLSAVEFRRKLADNPEFTVTRRWTQ